MPYNMGEANGGGVGAEASFVGKAADDDDDKTPTAAGFICC